MAESPEQAGLLIYNYKDARRKTFGLFITRAGLISTLDNSRVLKAERIEADPERDLLLDNQKRARTPAVCCGFRNL